MIAEIDEALRALIREEVLNGSGEVAISFEKPDEEWAAHQNTPTLNLYLCDVSENLVRREMAYEPVRGDDGRVVERRPPPRRFDLAYLVSVWTQRVEDEHRLLDDLLVCLLSHEELPRRHLPDELAEHPLPVRMTAGRPRPDNRKATDMWGAIGGTLKPTVDLVVTTPFVSRRVQVAGPPVLEEPRFAFAGPDGQDEQTRSGRRGRGAGAGGSEDAGGGDAATSRLAAEDVHGGRAPDETGGASTDRADEDDGDEVLTPGRRFVIREIPRQ